MGRLYVRTYYSDFKRLGILDLGGEKRYAVFRKSNLFLLLLLFSNSLSQRIPTVQVAGLQAPRCAGGHSDS